MDITSTAVTPIRGRFLCDRCGAMGSAPTHRIDCPLAQRQAGSLDRGDLIVIDGNFPAIVLTSAHGGRYGTSRVTTQDVLGGYRETRDYPPFSSVTVLGRVA